MCLIGRGAAKGGVGPFGVLEGHPVVDGASGAVVRLLIVTLGVPGGIVGIRLAFDGCHAVTDVSQTELMGMLPAFRSPQAVLWRMAIGALRLSPGPSVLVTAC